MVKAEAPVARRAADVKRVDRGAIVELFITTEDLKDRRRGEGWWR